MLSISCISVVDGAFRKLVAVEFLSDCQGIDMIESIKFIDTIASDLGLKEATLRDLSKVVILAGPNGSGKSRYLSCISRIVDRYRSMHRHYTSQNKNANLEKKIENINRTIGSRPPTSDEIESIKAFRDEISNNERLENELNSILKQSPFGQDIQAVIIDSTPVGEIEDPAKLAPASIRGKLNMVGRPFRHIYSLQHVYLGNIADILYHAEHPRNTDNASLQSLTEDAKIFIETLETLLGNHFSWYVEGNNVYPAFDGRPYRSHELSEGQRILITWAICLHVNGSKKFRDAIILIEEPETHLHPDACVSALKIMRDNIVGENGQLWISTHSPAVVASLSDATIYYVYDNTIEFASSQIDRVMDGLLGGKESRERMRDLLDEADVVSFLQMAADCLVSPKTLPAGENDPQARQLLKILSNNGLGGNSVRVLEFGAGRGRLAGTMAQIKTVGEERSFSYFAYNGPRFRKHEDECARNVELLSHIDGIESRVADTLSEFRGENEKIHVVLFLNTLHEIPPKEWIGIFSEIELILHDDGIILFMEDQNMRVGEKAHSYGFLVFNVDEIRALFKSGKEVDIIDTKKNGRVTAIAVPGQVLQNVEPYRQF